MKFFPRSERQAKRRSVDVLGQATEPRPELPWTVEQLDVLEAASKVRVGEREPSDRIKSSATLALIAPDRLDPAKVERNLATLRLSLRSREEQLADSKKLDPNLLKTYFEYLFCLSALRPGERYVFERPELAAKLDAYFEHVILVKSARDISKLGFYVTAFPEKRREVEVGQWPKLVEFIKYWELEDTLAEGLVGLRLISPDQFAQLGLDVQPGVEIVQDRVRHEMKWLRLHPESLVQKVAGDIRTLALLTANQIEFNPQGGLVIEHKSTLQQERPLPERSAV